MIPGVKLIALLGDRENQRHVMQLVCTTCSIDRRVEDAICRVEDNPRLIKVMSDPQTWSETQLCSDTSAHAAYRSGAYEGDQFAVLL